MMKSFSGSLKYLLGGFTSVSNYIIQNYHKLGLNDRELIMYLNLLSYASQNNVFPSSKDLANNLGITESEAFEIINSLETKHILSIETKLIDNKESSYYNLFHIFQLENKMEEKDEMKDLSVQLIQKFEVEFGRPLSPMELEKVNGWINIDKFRPDLIELALKEAILSQVYNFKYIDRILLNWKKRNIKTAQDYERSKMNNDLL